MAHLVGTNGNDSLVGTSGVDTIEGLAGNDTLVGLAGNDSLLGGLGDDRYVVGTGDILSDSGGTDTVESSVSWTLGAGFENLTFTGTAVTSGSGNNLNNVITGSAGNNWLRGLEGNDTINAGAGNDTIQMSNGSGTSYGSDVIDGGTGVDTLDFGTAARTAVTVDLGSGSVIGGGTAGAGSATVINVENVNGSAFDDAIFGSVAANFLFGFDGNDALDGGEGADRLEGGAGNDVLRGGRNTGWGGDGAADTFVGGLGDDEYHVADSGDTILADAGGIDTVYSAGDYTLGGGLENLFADDFTGSGFKLTGNELDNIIGGGSEWGSLWGMGGNDQLNLSNAFNFSDAHGGDGNDTLSAARDSTLFGDAGNDLLLADGRGSTMNGGSGADTFAFEWAGSSSPIQDFASGSDTVRLDASNNMSALGASGRFAPGDARFHLGTGAHDADDRVIYNSATGELLYDADGNGSASAMIIAVLQPGASVAATDIEVIDGTPAGSVMNGTEGDDTFYSSAGNDTINLFGGDDGVAMYPFAVNGDYGDDVINGGSGFDALYFFDDGQAQSGIVADLSVGQITGGGPGGIGSVQVTGIEFVEGTTLNDVLIGDDADNWFAGHLGLDTMAGGAGHDTLMGSQDAGGNTFIFEHFGAAHWDFIDIMSSADRIVLDGDAFTAIGPSGQFATNDARFYAADGANAGHDADDRVVYDTASGDLWYDADGSGAGAAALIGNTFGPSPVSAQQFVVVDGSAGGSTINGTAGDDTLDGTPGNDTINGMAGNDLINAGEGADSISGGSGNDTMFAGMDRNTGDGAVDSLDGGLGDDVYRHVSSIDGDVIVADAGGLDTVFAIGNWTLGGGLENLRFDDHFGAFWDGTGNELNNTIVSASAGGNLFGLGGNDLLVIANAEGFGSAHGGEGNDTLEAGRSTELFGDAGNDTLVASVIGSTMTGGAGNDSFVFETAGGTHQVEDFSSGVDKIRLDATTMPQLGTTGDFVAGDARFHTGAAAHDADDRVIYNPASGGLWFDADGNGSRLAEPIATLQPGATVVATDIAVDNGSAPAGGQTINGTANNDTLVGGPGNDTINGQAGADLIQGMGGNDSLVGSTGWDTIQGGDGNDWVHGGGWSDTVTGGAGSDSFVWNDAGSGTRDTVTDFASGTDELLFDNAFFTALGANSSWDASDGRFWAAAGAAAGHDADDRLVYNTSNGNLYYDADGSGAGAAQVVATFQGGSISASDITVI